MPKLLEGSIGSFRRRGVEDKLVMRAILSYYRECRQALREPDRPSLASYRDGNTVVLIVEAGLVKYKVRTGRTGKRLERVPD